jgi:UPF0716 family protein affecting phage T7 exclusion
VLGFLIFVGLLTLWMRRKSGPIAAMRKSSKKSKDIEMRTKDMDRSEDAQRRDEEEGLVDRPPSYQVAAVQK